MPADRRTPATDASLQRPRVLYILHVPHRHVVVLQLRPAVPHVLVDVEPEAAPHALLRLEVDAVVRTQLLRELLRDRQPHAHAAGVLRLLDALLRDGQLEQPLLDLLRDADSRVDDVYLEQLDLLVVALLRLQLHLEGDLALEGELRGVAHQRDYELRDPISI